MLLLTRHHGCIDTDERLSVWTSNFQWISQIDLQFHVRDRSPLKDEFQRYVNRRQTRSTDTTRDTPSHLLDNHSRVTYAILSGATWCFNYSREPIVCLVVFLFHSVTRLVINQSRNKCVSEWLFKYNFHYGRYPCSFWSTELRISLFFHEFFHGVVRNYVMDVRE